jgi:membrane protease YdiL (CAAX protease family)
MSRQSSLVNAEVQPEAVERPPKSSGGGKHRRLILLTPIALIIVGHLTARFFFRWLGVWTWAPLQIVYWSGMLAILYAAHAFHKIAAAYRRPVGWGWWVLGVTVGIIPLPILLLHLQLLRMPLLVSCWILIALVNPFIEESYWRGMLGEATMAWPGWLACSYSTVLFTAAHPLLWGVFSLGNRNWQTVIALLIMGLAWSITYRKTRSLRSITLSHALVDLGNMTVWVFLNLYAPPR